MNEEKFTSGRGGKREGAGRPKQEKVKKKFSFRLSEEEEKAVRELLAKMRGKLVIFFCLFALCLPVSAQTLQGGVTYTEETARQTAFEGVHKYCPFPNVEAFNRSLFVGSINKNDVLSIQEFNTKLAKIIPFNVIAVAYKDNPNYVYYYEKQNKGYKGLAVEIIIGNNYPVKTVKYDAKTGKLLSIGLTTSPYDDFAFDADGNLVGHWKGDKEILNKTAKRKVIYSAQ